MNLLRENSYTISQAAKILGVSAKTLKRWEKKGKIRISKTPGNNRFFMEEDIEVLKSTLDYSDTPSAGLSERKLYTISQAAKILGVSAKTLKRWEKKGKIQIVKTPGNNRFFTEEGLEALRANLSKPIKADITISKADEALTDLNFAKQNEARPEHRVPQINLERNSSEEEISSHSSLNSRLGVSPNGDANIQDYANQPKNSRFSAIRGIISPRLDALTSFFLIVVLSSVFLAFASINYFREKALSQNANLASAPVMSLSSISADVGAFKNLIVSGTTKLNGDVFIKGVKLDLASLARSSENTIQSISSSGNGISITGGKDVTISNTGVTSLQEKTGALKLEAGSGITIDGLKITNNNPNSSQNTFEKITVGDTTFSAGSTEDTLTFAAGNNISISSDTTNKKLTITGTVAATGWQLSGTNVILTDNSYNVGIGTAAPTSKLDVAGTASVSGALKLYGTPTVQSTSNQTLILGGDTTGDIRFKPANSSTSLYLASSGNVGIGTTAPSQLLHLSAATDTAVRFQAQTVPGGGANTDTGAISPGTSVNDASVGTNAWTNPGNATASDNVYATVAAAGTSQALKATNFGFTIPTGAPILGIKVEVERNSDTFSGLTTKTFSATGACEDWVVPDSVTSLSLDIQGAAGASTGKGGRVQGTLATTPGESLRACVGRAGTASGAGSAGGAGGFNGGAAGGDGTINPGDGGGGASDIRQGGAGLANRVGVAGGGGGNGGAAGGNGGGTTGQAGTTASGTNGGHGGGGGTPTAGGAGGTGSPNPDGVIGTSGAGGVGGGGVSSQNGGGGGGGGYWGGGGGEAGDNGFSTGGGGGGGGSSYDGGLTAPTHTQGFRSGNGTISVTYTLPGVTDTTVKIVKSDGTFGSTNKADTSTFWPTSDTYAAYGGATDLWGEAWTSTDINNPNFGAMLQTSVLSGVTASVDHMRITVYYTAAADVNWAMGSDYSATGNFKISNSSALGTSDRFTIDSAGNVGIGTTTPTALFDVAGAASISGALKLYGTPTIQSINNQTLTLGGNTTGDITLAPLNGVAGAYIAPNTNGAVDLGTSSLQFRNVYANNFIGAASGISGYWQRASGALSPTNITDDVLLGATSTTSAKFAFINVADGGTPTASISANSGNNALYIKGDGTLATTNRQTLTIGNSSTNNTTGNILINPNGTGFVGIGTNATNTSTALAVSGPNIVNATIADFQTNGGTVFKINTTNGLTLSTGGASNGSIANALTLGVTGGINITSETVPVQINAPTYTITGGYATQRITRFTQPTITAVSALNISTEADTVNIAGAPISAGSATIANSIALRISAGTNIAGGVTNGYGLYVDAPTGASNNYAAVFAGGNVGIGTTSPGTTLDVSGAVRTNNNLYVDGGTSNITSLNDVINVNKSLGANATGSWSTGTAGGTARYAHTSVLYNGKIYSWGGSAGSTTNTVDIYDIASNSWSTGTAGGTARYYHSSVLYNGKIYSWGGLEGPLNTVDIYDIASNSWSTGTAGGTARYWHTSVLYNGKIYSWGGANSGGTIIDTVDIYDIASNSWSTGTAGGTARYYHSSVLYNGKIYSWGGFNSVNTLLNTVDIYDIASNSWSTGTAGGTARRNHTSILYNGKVYSWGGNTGGGSINTVDIYDIANNSWSTGTAGGTARRNHTSVLYNGKIYSWGGANTGGTNINTVDIYDIGFKQTILALQENGQDTFDFQTGSQLFLNSGRMGIMGGNVGIGTANPTAKLDVAGTASVSGALKLYGTPTLQSTANRTLTIGGDTTGNIVLSPLNSIAGSKVIPGADNLVSLGASSSARFKDLFLGPSSLHIQCTTGDGCSQNLDWNQSVDTTTGTLKTSLNGTTVLSVDTSGALSAKLNQLTADYTVDSSSSAISVGDIVAYINGKAQKSFSTSTTTITPGTPAALNAVNSTFNNVGFHAAVLDSTHFVVVYQNFSTGFINAVVSTVSGTTITPGTPVALDAVISADQAVAVLDSTHFVTAYNINSTGFINAVVSTVSGTTITPGTPVALNAVASNSTSTAVLDSTHFVTAYNINSTGFINAVVSTVSGTTITPGTPVALNAVVSNTLSVAVLDSTHFVTAYRSSTTFANAVVSSVSGTTITAGTPVALNAVFSIDTSVAVLDSTHFVVAYYNNSTTFASAVDGTVSGTTITPGTPVALNAVASTRTSAAILDSTHFVTAYKNGSTTFANAVVSTYGAVTTTSSNVLGMATNAASANGTVNVASNGIVSGLTGLTAGSTYYWSIATGLTTSVQTYKVGIALTTTSMLLNSGSGAGSDQFFGDMIFANNFRITESPTSPQALLFQNQLGRQIAGLDENGNLSLAGSLFLGASDMSTISSISAQLATLSSQFDTLEQDLNKQKETMASLSAQLANLPTINFTKFATGGAILGITTVDEDFAVAGNTTLNSLNTIGNITVANNLVLGATSINTVGEDLQIQPLKQAGVSFMNGLVNIDTQGNVKIMGELRADSVTLTKNKTVGNSTIPAGETSVTIETSAIEPDSQILVTPTTSTSDRVMYVSDKKYGESFTVSLDDGASATDIKFGWIIIGGKP